MMINNFYFKVKFYIVNVTEINFQILTSPVAEPVVVAELVEVKPPSSLAFSCGRFDASTSSATTSSTTILSKKPSQNYK